MEGALYIKGCAMASTVYPATANQKLKLIKHLTQRPKVVNPIPIVTPTLNPNLSKAITEGKLIGMNMIM